MARRHLFEFEDQTWLPSRVRDGITDFLRDALVVGGRVYAPVVPLLDRVLKHAGTDRIVDLCSGGSGPWIHLHADLAAAGISVRLILTDKFPNHAALEAAASAIDADRVRYEARSVEARAVPAELAGVRTLFTALHHFRPAEVAGILQDAYRRREGFAAFEFTERRVGAVLGTLVIAPMLVLTTTFRRRPDRLRMVLTYLLPVIPIAVTWDAVVSNLRTYSVAELRSLVADLDDPGYAWEAGVVPGEGRNPPVTYLLGYPLTNPT